MDIPPEILAQLPEKVWQPYKIRTGLRQLKELRTGHQERRGRKKQYDDVDFIRIYIEIEAHARKRTRGRVLSLLNHHKLRLIASDRKPSRLTRQDRQRLRQQHAEGKREARAWYNIKFMHCPHPKWFEIQRHIETRMDELRSSEELFFLKMV